MRALLLWGVLGVASYVVGGLLLLGAVVPLATADGIDFGAVTPMHGALVATSVVLFAFGGFCVRRGQSRYDGRRGDSELPERFRSGARLADERSGAEGSDRPGEEGDRRGRPPGDWAGDREEPQSSGDATGATVRCPHCGAENDPEYTFCGHCSKELGG